jgi:hypothetical protein
MNVGEPPMQETQGMAYRWRTSPRGYGCTSTPSVDGFDESFAAYGFTETSLVARLIAAGVPVIPQVKAVAVHVEANPAHHSREERNALFRAAHRRFYREFLTR